MRVALVGACEALLQPVSQQHSTGGPYGHQLLCGAPGPPVLKGLSMTSYGQGRRSAGHCHRHMLLGAVSVQRS